jgi:hypothetical protein
MTATDHQDDDVTIALFITQGLIEQDHHGTWKLTEEGWLTLSNNQHKLPAKPLTPDDEIELGRLLASFGQSRQNGD